MIDWLEVFMQHEVEGFSCSCSGDCDRERQAAYAEILRLRAAQTVAPSDLPDGGVGGSDSIASDYADSAG